MKISQRYLRAGGVLVLAALIGHVMQNGDAIASRLGVGDSLPDASPDRRPSAPVTQIAALSTPRIGAEQGLDIIPGGGEVAPAQRRPQHLSDPNQRQLAALHTANDAVPEPPLLAETAMSADCTPVLSARPEAAALVTLALVAPCHPEARVIIAHAGLAFHLATDNQGAMSATVPAMELSAHFTATLDGNAPVSTRVEVPALADYDRVAVTWAGAAGLELHAFEFGASYGEPGHVWRGNAGSGHGGFSLLFGDAMALEPMLTEVYTYPTGRSTRDGVVQLSVEAEVTPANCGQDVSARAIGTEAGRIRDSVELTLSVPECDAVGEYVVANDLFPDFRIAVD